MKASLLTQKQSAVLMYLVQRRRTVYPTIRQAAKYFGVSIATMHQHIVAIKNKGFLPQGERQKRLTEEKPK